MDRRTDVRRDSKPTGPALFRDVAEKALLEAKNGLIQFDLVVQMATEAKAAERFKLRPSTVQALQRAAIHGLYTCAGNYRSQQVEIHGTSHVPPAGGIL